ncbi:hypothetical protein SAMN05216337_1001189 [Bradyrhizobium brasilense]|uniref:Uncharacterized protein n=1 Tax=Bradyrhizobium brasilense TaxID=1419277 RepID=A0A1G6ILP6_9BRAD|nr:hypothetical protein [Bradyrhizobium brasilense]SDC07407.1 hypothetical protein SAMN05216337_1001189 [Bradyrhizobium brasilense]
MNPPGKTTLARMQHTAQLEAGRIEIVQDYWVREGRIAEPAPDQVARRDDFAGIVRLIDLIQSDQVILDRLEKRAAAKAAAPTCEISQVDGPAPDMEIEGGDE